MAYWILSADFKKWKPELGDSFNKWSDWNKPINYNCFISSKTRLKENAANLNKNDIVLIHAKRNGIIGIGYISYVPIDKENIQENDYITVEPIMVLENILTIDELTKNNLTTGYQNSFTSCDEAKFNKIIDLASIRSTLNTRLKKLGLNFINSPKPNIISKEKIINFSINQDVFDSLYLPKSIINKIVDLLKRKKNIILQGPPGVGKTYIAKKIAESITDTSNSDFVQFHQNYSYEDFVIGYKPNEKGGFDLIKGKFYLACLEADKMYNTNNKQVNPYVFTIDEINRGNISKIFGELLMLIENNYRGHTISLASNTQFSVPKNLYIIGMMNTADRSLAMIDYALRRRFSFISIPPVFEGIKDDDITSWGSPDSSADETKRVFAHFLNKEKLNTEYGKSLIKVVIDLNREIEDKLGKGFIIGHSYFCNLSIDDNDITKECLRDVIEYDIVPLLEEYWFDDTDMVKKWKETLFAAVQ